MARSLPVILLSALLLALLGCGSGGKQSAQLMPGPGDAADSLAGEPGGLRSDPGAFPLAGEATLLAGARTVPDPTAEQPLPRLAAQAGVDFAANRFIAILENSPQANAMAPYMGNGVDGTADMLRASDNQPLVQHPYFRRVSSNLASHYGLDVFGRVFYKDVNFVVLELPEVESVADLDRMMLRVLNENRGLVREVCYDTYLKALGSVDAKGQQVPQELVDGLIRSMPGRPRDAAPAPSRRVSTPPNDPMHLNRNGSNGGTWANWRVGAFDTYNDGTAWTGCYGTTVGSSSVLVSVLDTGCRVTHEDLVGNVIVASTTPPYNAPGILTDVINKDNDPADGHGHGTNCCGCVGAVGNNAKGLSGMCQTVKILPIKVLSDGGSGSDSQVSEGILLADYLGANILSLSLGGPFADRTTQLAVKQCHADGRLVVIAAGNENTSAPSYPGYYPEALCVGATTLVNGSGNQDFSHTVDTNGDTTADSLPITGRFDARASFSNYGAWVDIAAPGVEVRTTSRASDTSYTAATAGTSFACPYTAGCAALLWSHMGAAANAGKVRGLLQSSATSIATNNNTANPKCFIDNSSNGTVGFCNVKAAIDLYNTSPGAGPTITWDNPAANSTVSGTVEIRVAVSGGSGTTTKVEFYTATRHLGTVTAPSGGFYRLNWNTVFEFNRRMDLNARAYDNKGNIITSTIQVTPNNAHVLPNWSENVSGTANNALPSGWSILDGNQGSGNTVWGADDSQGSAALPSLHSSGTTADFAAQSNDWLFAPIIDLRGKATASLSFNFFYRRSSADIWFLYTVDDANYFVEYISTGNANYPTEGVWGTRTVNLNFLAGREVRLMWVIQRDGGGGSGGSGLWIDDISVTSGSGTPPTISITAPANGATVSGMVTTNVTLSDDVVQLRVEAIPPALGTFSFNSIPDNDPGSGNKTFSFKWDSRHTWNGPCLFTVYALDDEDGDTIADDLMAQQSISLTVNNANKSLNWYEGFESITTLGGTTGGGNNFDGDWYLWGGGASTWRINTVSPHAGSKTAKFGPADGSNYGANEFDQLYSPMVSCPSAVHPYLRFFHKLDVEGTGAGGDMAKLYIVRYLGIDDTEVPMAEYRADSSPAGSWVEQSFDLSKFKSTPFRFNLLFDSDGDGNAGAGWFIDSFEVLDANPSITNLTPNRAVNGSSITINGSNFGGVQGSSTVTFQKDGGGTVNATVTSWTNTVLTVTVPANAAKGNVTVSVLGFSSNGVQFTPILAPPSLDGLGQL
ncbi:S8 family serine peptidase [bacterium]|nr:S8 family serine peptidase [bacterium]